MSNTNIVSNRLAPGANASNTTFHNVYSNMESSSILKCSDVIINDSSLKDTLSKINERLCIIEEPDLEKLKKFESLKKAYEQYKLIEKLIQET